MKNILLSAIGLSVFGACQGLAQSPVPINSLPSRIVGHPKPEQNGALVSLSPNLVEGREMWSPQGVALDTSVTPPILYASDGNNNRVLAWKNATAFNTGQPADLVIGQQDFFHTNAQGPGIGLQTGLYAPTGLAVFKGDLYVADTNNNRILRYPKPFANAPNNVFPDLYIGQPSLNSKTANYTGQVDKQGISLAGVGSSLAFDAIGNLWITDPGNRRVLRFKAADVAGTGGPLTADLEIGQPLGFTEIRPPLSAAEVLTANIFATPLALGFDPSGRLFVSDTDGSQINRVLVFPGPFTSNAPTAARIMGVFGPGQTPSLDQQSKTLLFVPTGLFFIPGAPGKVGVVDSGKNRILLFDSFDNWPNQNTSYSPQAAAVVGQLNFTGLVANGGTSFTPAPGNSTFFRPVSAFFSGAELYVADSGNNRLVGLPFSGGTFAAANAVWGQDRFDTGQPNLIEGREFYFSSGQAGVAGDAGIALDTSGDTPHLYVSDTLNHRVLGFNDFRKLGAGAQADVVIGQPDLKSGLCNVTGDQNSPTRSSLCRPTGLLVDSSGNLYVADTFNGRVLRFPAPFAHKGSEQADLVLGQHNFTSTITDPTPSTMARPYGLAFTGNIGMLVSDVAHNRVLFFPFSANATFDPSTDNGKAATKVLGQPDFNTITAGNTDANMNNPHHLATDPDGRPYVADTSNNRVLIFDTILNNPNTGARASLILPNLTGPQGIFVNSLTAEIWITDTNSGNASVRKYPRFGTLQFNPASTGVVQAAFNPLAVAQDQYGDVIVADASNRVGFYFPGLQGINGINLLPNRPLAPGLIASICASGSNCSGGAAYLGSNTAYVGDLPNPFPLPTTLGDVQVLFNNQPSALYYVSPGQINFVVPNNAPTSGSADVTVVQPSTGRVYAAGPVPMNTVSPAIFMKDFTGARRQALVFNNDDGTVNSPTNAAARGSLISIFATGQGFLANAPLDGNAPPSLVETPLKPTVVINACDVNDTACTHEPAANIPFSGLSPQFPGVWQINVRIPQNTGIGPQVPIAVIVNSVSSFDINTAGWATTIAVK